MKKSIFKKIIFSSGVLATSSICALTALNVNSVSDTMQLVKNADETTSSTISFNSDQKWINDIKEAATAAKNNGNIQMFFTRNASLLYQQSLISLLYLFDNINGSSKIEDTAQTTDETSGGGYC